jgi:hypothetical protein
MRNSFLYGSLISLALLLSACDNSPSSSAVGDGMGGPNNGGGDQNNGDKPPSGNVVTVDPNIVRFIIMGDSGSGTDAQMAVGAAMADVCEAKGKATAVRTLTREEAIKQGCQFVLGFGDNIYDDGTRTVTDEKFFTNFERAYLTFPSELPFYMVSGNHDNSRFFGGDGASNARGETQVAYTFQPVDSTGKEAKNPRKTPRWRMPSRYFDFTAGGTPEKPLVHFFAIDSNQVAGGFPDASPDYSYSTYGLRQLNWLKSGLSTSNAQFKIGFAHHPYLSNGEHGNAGNYDDLIASEAGQSTKLPFAPSFQAALLPVLAGQRYKDFLEEALCDEADVFMSGHDHDLQWLSAVPSCGRTEFIVSGAAGKVRSAGDEQRNLARIQHYDTLGFFWVEIKLNKQANKPVMLSEMYTVKDGEGTGRVMIKKIDGTNDKEVSYQYRAVVPEASSNELKEYLATNGDGTNSLVLNQRPKKGLTGKQSPFSSVPIFDNCGAFTIPSAQSVAARQEVSARESSKGPLDPVQDTLNSGVNTWLEKVPEGPQQQAVSALLKGVDESLDIVDVALKASIDTTNQPMVASQLQQAAAVDMLGRLKAMGANMQAALPAKSNDPAVNQLRSAVTVYNQQMAARSESTVCRNQDLGILLAPLVQLSRNLANIADAPSRVAAGVPVIGGTTRLLANALSDTTALLASLGSVQSSNVNDALLGLTDRLLKNLVTGVIPLDQAPAEVADAAELPIAGVSSALMVVTREVTYHLDQQLLGHIAVPLSQLVTGLLTAIGLGR